MQEAYACPGGTPTGLHWATSWPRMDQGCFEHLSAWLGEHPECRTIIIDTFAKLRRPRKPNGDIYADDYQDVAQFQAYAVERNIVILLVTHTRKPKGQADSDPLDELQGSTGLTGAADVILVLRRQRHSQDGQLFITGRDIEERELALVFQNKRWREPRAIPVDHALSPDWKKARAILFDTARPMKLPEICAAANWPMNRTKLLLARMFKDGFVNKPARSWYVHPDVDQALPLTP
jgi:hypothetical protein